MTVSISKKQILVIAGVFLLLLLYFFYDPMQAVWMPQCIFHKITGLQCMGCGSQRVVHSLLHGDFSSALKANALLVIGLPFLFFLLWIELTRKKNPKLYRKIHSKGVIITVSAILGVWLILRNILGI